MKLIFRLLLLAVVLCPVLLQAQSGIGTFSPDSDKALHDFAFASIEAPDLFQTSEDDDWYIESDDVANANTGNVGIGSILTAAPTSMFHFIMNMRIEDQSSIEFDNSNAPIYLPNSGFLDTEAEDLETLIHRRVERIDPSEVNYRYEFVGVGLNDPNAPFEIGGLPQMCEKTQLHLDGSNLLDEVLNLSSVKTLNNDVNINLPTSGKKITITGNGTGDPLQLDTVQAVGAVSQNALVLDVTGNMQMVCGVTASDRRLKENIKPMEGTLEKLLGMESVTFNYRKYVKDYPYSLDEETHYGVIAQQVQAAFPHAVIEKDGYLHIQEKELLGVVISATKELSAKNAELEAANEHLAEQLHHMMMDKADLEKTVHSLEAQTSELQTSMNQVLQHIANGKQVQAGGN